MSKILAKINIAINFLMLLAFIVTGFSTVVADKILPRDNGHVNILWGISRGKWINLHDRSGYLLIILILIHLGLHWRWFAQWGGKIGAWVKSLRKKSQD